MPPVPDAPARPRLPRRPAALLAALPVLPVLAAPLAAEDYDGRYKLTQDSDCAAPAGAPGFLRIENGVFFGAESRCTMANPIEVRDMEATLYDMLCTGEGMTWQERALVMRGAEDDLILVWDGYAFSYPRCPAPTLRPEPRPARLAER